MPRRLTRNGASTPAVTPISVDIGSLDLSTLGGRIRFIRYRLYGLVSQAEFGRKVADYERQLTGVERDNPYWSGSVRDWEVGGAVPNLYAAMAIAQIGQVPWKWFALGEGSATQENDEDGLTFAPRARPKAVRRKA